MDDDAPERRRQDRLIVDHLGLADAVAARIPARAGERDDLRQVARVGLVNAARRYDPDRGFEFAAFAVPTISGELKRHLRDHGWAVRPPRRIQELRASIAAARPALTQELSRTPRPAELAERVGASLAEVREAVDADGAVQAASLDRPLGDDDDANLLSALGGVELGFERVERIVTISSACRALPERLRRVVYLSYFAEWSQHEIAAELHVSQVQISRLLAQALDRMRRSVRDQDAVPAHRNAA